MYQQRIETPLKTLRSSVNKDVLVKVKDGNSYVGRLIMTDPTMNIVMTDCEELTDKENPVAKYGTVLIRGSQILYIVVDYRPS
ncbi:MAG TPA: Sm ribonucleo [Thermoprotei archaeon]|nr:MAG: Sm ribonucleo [Thermoprotei archaeon]HDJ51015.1 Sm ribonucleo [Thermoprotei archaeon]HDN02157.1 Sm ribonucleo [Candidatus Bathyarchaeota archaeon]